MNQSVLLFKVHLQQNKSLELMKKSIIFLLFTLNLVHSQAPIISYTTPNVFNVNQSITDLLPTNTGGTIIAQTLVSTFAGSGNVGSTDGNGIAASFNLPTVVTIDNFGNIFVVDRSIIKLEKLRQLAMLPLLQVQVLLVRLMELELRQVLNILMVLFLTRKTIFSFPTKAIIKLEKLRQMEPFLLLLGLE